MYCTHSWKGHNSWFQLVYVIKYLEESGLFLNQTEIKCVGRFWGQAGQQTIHKLHEVSSILSIWRYPPAWPNLIPLKK